MTLNGRKQTFAFVNGLRGIAASQVVMLHYGAAFLPVLVRAGSPMHFRWEQTASFSPLFLVAQGYVAVYVFFVMSGFVLGHAFTRSQASTPAEVAKRFVRLYLPVFAAVLFAFVCLRLAPLPRFEAWKVSQSTWLGGLYQAPLDAHLFWSDALFHSMLLGYAPNSLFASWGVLHPAIPIWQAIDPPLWTIHYEFWGSLTLIAIAVVYRHFPGWALVVAVIITLFISGSSFLCLFVLGFVLHLVHDRLDAMRDRRLDVIGIGLLVVGLWLGASRQQPLLDNVYKLTLRLPIMRAFDAMQFQWQISALSLFVGFLLSARLRRLTASRSVLWLGKISFSLYLIHFPVLMTLGCWLFVRLQGYGYLFASGVSLAVGFSVSLFLAAFFEKLIDKPAVMLSRMCTSTSIRDRVFGHSVAEPTDESGHRLGGTTSD
jgi:peptidoglycan/LPS O-acetylase OafA/YrhL